MFGFNFKNKFLNFAIFCKYFQAKIAQNKIGFTGLKIKIDPQLQNLQEQFVYSKEVIPNANSPEK
jgi:hypothetical protein